MSTDITGIGDRPLDAEHPPADDAADDDIGLLQMGTWLGEGKRLIVGVTVGASVIAGGLAFQLTPVYTARTSLLPPGSQAQSGSAAALAALGSLGGLAGMGTKTPDELYVALLRSDSVLRGLDQQFKLKERYGAKNFELLRKILPARVRVTSDKKSGLISLEVDDAEPAFAATLANAHVAEIAKVLSRLAVSEAQQRRLFFERQLKETKENLVKAEADLREVQERSGVIALDKQAEAVIAGAAQVRGAIADREVRLRVLRTSSTDQNPDVMRLTSELQGLRAELARMETQQGAGSSDAGDLPVGKLPEVAVAYVRARRELRLQELLMEAMVRQFESAKLDEAREGPLLQQVDPALPPDHKSKPARMSIVAGVALAALLITTLWTIARRYAALSLAKHPQSTQALRAMLAAWRWRSGRRPKPGA
jgi:capsule polysaccharide export protein KpsE/RkpR